MPQTQAEVLDETPECQLLIEEVARLEQVASDLQSELVGLQTRQAASDRVEKLILAQAVAECKSDITAISGQLADTKKQLAKQQSSSLQEARMLDLRAEFASAIEAFNELSVAQSKVLGQLYQLDRAYLAASGSEQRLCQGLRIQETGMALSPQLSRFESTGYGWVIHWQKVDLH